MITIQAPDVGSIVGCWFPYDGSHNPGPDFRPCLVLQVVKRMDKNTVDLVVCYGTGQTLDCNKITTSAWSIEIEKGCKNKLSETTRFNLKKVATLSFDSRFFSPPAPFANLAYCRIGMLSDEEDNKVVSILTKFKVLDNINCGHKTQIYTKK